MALLVISAPLSGCLWNEEKPSEVIEEGGPYFGAFSVQYGDAQTGFLPQSFQSHTKKKIQDILRIFGRTGLKLGGKLADSKGVLAERLASWLNRVSEAGRDNPVAHKSGEESGSNSGESDNEPCHRKGGISYFARCFPLPFFPIQ